MIDAILQQTFQLTPTSPASAGHSPRSHHLLLRLLCIPVARRYTHGAMVSSLVGWAVVLTACPPCRGVVFYITALDCTSRQRSPAFDTPQEAHDIRQGRLLRVDCLPRQSKPPCQSARGRTSARPSAPRTASCPAASPRGMVRSGGLRACWAPRPLPAGMCSRHAPTLITSCTAAQSSPVAAHAQSCRASREHRRCHHSAHCL